jgi:hypothetical protein
MSPLDSASLDSSLDDVRHCLLAARGIRARLLALRERAGLAARAFDGALAELPTTELDSIASCLDDVAAWLDDVCGRLSV